MYKLLLTGCISTFLLAACANEGSSGSAQNVDSASGMGHHSTGHNGSIGDSSTAGANSQQASLMDMMNRNMQEMKAVQSTGNPDNDFAALMKIHHMGALEMAQAELAQGQDQEMRAMAQKMVAEQQKEIAQLNTFLSGHDAHGGGDAFYKEVMGQMNHMKMDMDHSGSFDKQFAQMMIPHHQGAIDMSRAYLKAGAHEATLKTFANKIITDQQKEINELQAWLSKNQ